MEVYQRRITCSHGCPFSVAASAQLHAQDQRDSGFSSAAALNLSQGIHREASPTFGRKQLKSSERILNLSQGIHPEAPFWVSTIKTFEANHSLGAAIFIEETVRGHDLFFLLHIGKEHSVQFVRV